MELKESLPKLMDTERFNRALSLLNSGDADSALREFGALAESTFDDEERGSILLSEVSCLTYLGRIAEARERWREAVAHVRDSYTDYVDICLCLTENKNIEAMLKLAEFLKRREELVRSDAEDIYSDAAERFGALLFGDKRYDEAIEPFRNSLLAPGTEERKANLLMNLAICYIQTGDLDGAEGILKGSLSLDRDHPLWPAVQYHLGRLYFRKGTYARAREAFECCQLSTSDEEERKSAFLWLDRINADFPPVKRIT